MDENLLQKKLDDDAEGYFLSTFRQHSLSTHEKRVTLNIGGFKHEVTWKRMEKVPLSRLGRLRFARSAEEFLSFCDDYNVDANEIFFDRYPGSFGSVLNYYRTDKLHVVEDMCVLAFHDDLRYWGIDEILMETCCQIKYQEKAEMAVSELRKEEEMRALEHENSLESTFGVHWYAQLQENVWMLMEHPNSSIWAKIIAIMSVLCIVISSMTLILDTIPCFHDFSNPNDCDSLTVKAVFTFIDLVCNGLFTLKFVVRFCAAPNKLRFCKSVLNIVECVVLILFYLSYFLSNQENLHILSLFRVLRMLRVIKLARHSRGLQAMGQTLKHSYKELGLFVMFLSIAILLFSSLAYYAENNHNPLFSSIPATFWWAILTITTVGYGDIVPVTPLGKVTASLCCLCGVIVLAMPISIITNNFTQFYKDLKSSETAKKRLNERLKVRSNLMTTLKRMQMKSGLRKKSTTPKTKRLPIRQTYQFNTFQLTDTPVAELNRFCEADHEEIQELAKITEMRDLETTMV